jgi:hypothetical protein
MSKTLSESAAEILKASMSSAGKEPAQSLPAEMDDLGGQTPEQLPTAIGAKASADMKEAPKPGVMGAPAEPMKKLPGSDAKKVGDEEEGLKKNPVDAGSVKAEETEVEGEVVTEEEESLEEGKTKVPMPLPVKGKKVMKEDEEVVAEAKSEDDEADEEEEDEDEEEDDAEEMKMKMKKEMVEKYRGSMREDVDALFNGESLSEDFRVKATLIFETAVQSRVEKIVEEVLSENDEILAAAVEEIKGQLAEQVDDYLNYVVEEWVQENQVAIETGLRAELAEDFISGLKSLFEEHYIEIPEEKVDVAEELAVEVASLQEAAAAKEAEFAALAEELNAVKKEKAITLACEGLTQVQAEKIKSLAESVEFTTEGDFNNKLAIIRENYFPSKVSVKSEVKAIQESAVEEPEVEPIRDAIMNRYVQALTKTAPKA